MGDKKYVQISGPKLLKLRLRLALTQAELGREIGVNDSRVRQIETSAAAGIYPKSVRGLAKLLGTTPDQVATQLAPDPEPLDTNVEPYSEQKVPEIPVFELAVAAGPWTEVCEVGALEHPGLIADGRFRIKIRGDSMEGKGGYEDGSLVEFRCLRPPGEYQKGDTLEVGKDYYVQRMDDATFKKLESFTDEMFVLRAINKKKYPEKMSVLRSDVMRMAKAVAVVRLIG